jgi:hypothetical protein
MAFRWRLSGTSLSVLSKRTAQRTRYKYTGCLHLSTKRRCHGSRRKLQRGLIALAALSRFLRFSRSPANYECSADLRRATLYWLSAGSVHTGRILRPGETRFTAVPSSQVLRSIRDPCCGVPGTALNQHFRARYDFHGGAYILGVTSCSLVLLKPKS